MGSQICLAMRDKNGRTLSAFSYSHVMERIHTEIDLTAGDALDIEPLVKEYADDSSYGPAPIAPIDGGLLFFDFPRKRIVDAQSIAYFPAITKDGVLRMLSKDPAALDEYAPHFHTKLAFRKDVEFGAMEIEETPFAPASTMEDVWRNAGIESALATKRGDDASRAPLVPVGSFYALVMAMPGWQVASYDRQSSSQMTSAMADVSESVALSDADEQAWHEFIAARPEA